MIIGFVILIGFLATTNYSRLSLNSSSVRVIINDDDTSTVVPVHHQESQNSILTYDNPTKYRGKHVEGWPPLKDRHMPNYIRPEEDTFLLRPVRDIFKHCDMVVMVHSRMEAFVDRMAVRNTWLQFVTGGQVQNVSVVFVIGSQNAAQNVTHQTK